MIKQGNLEHQEGRTQQEYGFIQQTFLLLEF